MHKLLNTVEDYLSLEAKKIIFEFIENNELGLAYETICTLLYENNVQISNDTYKKIVFFENALEIQPSTWLSLKELIK